MYKLLSGRESGLDLPHTGTSYTGRYDGVLYLRYAANDNIIVWHVDSIDTYLLLHLAHCAFADMGELIAATFAPIVRPCLHTRIAVVRAITDRRSFSWLEPRRTVVYLKSGRELAIPPDMFDTFSGAYKVACDA